MLAWKKKTEELEKHFAQQVNVHCQCQQILCDGPARCLTASKRLSFTEGSQTVLFSPLHRPPVLAAAAALYWSFCDTEAKPLAEKARPSTFFYASISDKTISSETVGHFRVALANRTCARRLRAALCHAASAYLERRADMAWKLQLRKPPAIFFFCFLFFKGAEIQIPV